MKTNRNYRMRKYCEPEDLDHQYLIRKRNVEDIRGSHSLGNEAQFCIHCLYIYR